MMTMVASRTGSTGVARSRLDVQSAHFDVALASAGGIRATPAGPDRPVDLLVDGLASRERSTVLLNYVHYGETGLPDWRHSETFDRGTPAQKIIALPSDSWTGDGDGHHPAGYPDPIFYTAMKLLCFDDRLFNLKGGSDFVRTSVSAARRAGRITVLLCTDLSTGFMKRQEIADSFGGHFDLVVGEPAAVLCLFGVNRIDTLVPRLIQCGTGLVLHRIDFPPIYIQPRNTAVAVAESPISASAFWSKFVPSVFDELIAPRLRAA